MKKLLLILLLLPVFVEAQIITTVAGDSSIGYNGDNILATTAELYYPSGVAIDPSGNIYIADLMNQRIRKVDNAGIITTIAGNGIQGFSGDGGPAIMAEITQPHDILIDTAGNIYFSGGARIRKITPSGLITTIAGGGTGGLGDGGPATAAEVGPLGMAMDQYGNIYFADTYRNLVRKIDTLGIVTSIAGDGTAGYGGDGGPATNAELLEPYSVAVDAIGNIYIADYENARIRKVNTSGIISTFAGIGTSGSSGDGGPATDAQLYAPTCLVIDNNGNLYIGDDYNASIRVVNTAGIISKVAGNGTWTYSGDGGVADSAGLDEPMGLCLDNSSNIYIADYTESRIRRVSSTLSIKTTNNIETDIKVYPNPASTSLTITTSYYINSIIISNLIGQTVYTLSCNTQQVQVDVSAMPTGILFIKVNGTQVRKFVKE